MGWGSGREGCLFGSKHFMFLITHCLFSSWNPHRLRNSDWASLPKLEQDYLRRDCSFKAFLGQVCWARSYISVPQNKTPWNDMVKDSKINNHFFFPVMFKLVLRGLNCDSDLLPSLLWLPSICIWRTSDKELSSGHIALLSPL